MRGKITNKLQCKKNFCLALKSMKRKVIDISLGIHGKKLIGGCIMTINKNWIFVPLL